MKKGDNFGIQLFRLLQAWEETTKRTEDIRYSCLALVGVTSSTSFPRVKSKVCIPPLARMCAWPLTGLRNRRFNRKATMRLPQKQKIKVTIATTPADSATTSPVGKRPSKGIVCITAKSDRWVVWHHVPASEASEGTL